MKIIHIVQFNLKHEKGSMKEKQFFEDSISILSTIGAVQNFTVFNQVSKKNNFTYAFSMEFASAEDYQEYNKNRNHQQYVQSRWLEEVADFMEIDLVQQ